MGLLNSKKITSGYVVDSEKRLKIYVSGTDSYAPIYAGSDFTELQENPLTPDENGNFPTAFLVDGAYRVELCSSRDGTVLLAQETEISTVLSLGNAHQFDRVTDILEDTYLSYNSDGGQVQVAAGQTVQSLEGQFSYKIAPQNEDRAHLTTAGGVKLYCEPNHDGAITLRQVGGLEGGDITEPLQHAIMVASFGNAGGPVAGTIFIDVFNCILSDTVHLHYGCSLSGTPNFRGLKLRGLGRPYNGDSQNMGTEITCSMTDRPAFVIQNGRFCEISGITITGPALLTQMTTSDAATYTEAGWDAVLTQSGITSGMRFAPHAAIAIDPYSGSAPNGTGTDAAYPPVTPHPWIDAGGFSQYGYAGGSSQTSIKDLQIRGWEVGVVQQPGNISSNSDFLIMRNLDIRHVKYADSIGTTQARNTIRDSCQYNNVWTITTNSKHGHQTGTASGGFNNCAGAGFIGKLFDLNSLSYGGGIVFNQFDVEGLWMIGNVSNSTSTDGTITFNQCSLGFIHVVEGIHPGRLITGNTSGVFEFNSCTMQNFDSTLSFSRLNSVLNNSFIEPNATRSKDYQRLAHNTLSGGVIPNLLGVKSQRVRFVPQVVGGGTAGAQVLGPEFRFTNRNYCIPIAAGISTFFQRYLEGSRTPSRTNQYLTRDIGTHFTVTNANDTAITIDLSSQFANDQDIMQRGYLPGDIAVHEPTGTTMFVRSTDDSGAGGSYSGGTGEVILELQNNYHTLGGSFTILDPSFLNSGESWVFIPSRIYVPEVPIIGSISSSSAVISVLALAGFVPANYGLEIGDCYWEDQDASATFSSTGRAFIAAVDKTANTITMSGNATQTLNQNPFTYWCRTPPANAASR